MERRGERVDAGLQCANVRLGRRALVGAEPLPGPGPLPESSEMTAWLLARLASPAGTAAAAALTATVAAIRERQADSSEGRRRSGLVSSEIAEREP